MPRLARKDLDSSFIHIIIQGINKEYIFKKDLFKETYLNILKNNIKITNIDVIAYCIMDNHAHLLVYCENINIISKVMQKTNGTYAKFYNRIQKRVGYVFRNRYYTQAMLTEQQLYNCIAYIHKNPIKANMVNYLEEYKYSSYREYLGKRNFITNRSIKLVFGTSKVYLDMFNSIHKIEDIENIKEVVEEFNDEKTIVNEYLNEVGKNLLEIKQNKKLLAELIFRLRYQGGLSLRVMEKILGISKSYLAVIINKKLK